MNEFSRSVDLRQPMLEPEHLQATPDECAALAKRFGLVAVDRLTADVGLSHEGDALRAKGSFKADVIQICAISGEELPVRIAEQIDLRFVAAGTAKSADEEVELALEELDEIEFSGTAIDLGEAVAQSLALAIDPFAAGPEAERVRDAGLVIDKAAAGPFAALAKLTKPH